MGRTGVSGKGILAPGNGKFKTPLEGKFEACIPGNHGKREFPLTPDVLVDFFGVILKGGSKHFHRNVHFLGGILVCRSGNG